MTDPLDTAAAMAYHPKAHRLGAVSLSAFLAQPSFSPALTFPDVASLSEPLSEDAVSDAELHAALRRQRHPTLKSLQLDEGLFGEPKVALESNCLWKEFHRMGTEIVVTKSGRCCEWKAWMIEQSISC
uniref:T-box domain-containing protein n=1 Tax=Monopterus albus TaxID=43700 RepID=A0A3Q3IHB8_MONAL